MRNSFCYWAGCVITRLLVVSIFIGVKANARNIYMSEHLANSYKLATEKARILSDTSGTDTDAQVGAVYPVVYTNLLAHLGSNFFLTDGVAAAFDNRFSAAVDGYDAAKLWNFRENIAIDRNNFLLAAEFRPVPMLRDTLSFRLYLKQQPYTLQFFTQNFSGMASMRTWLVDTYLNTKTEINLNDTTLYNFTPNPDTLSYRNRFMLVFNRQLIATPVPVTKIVNEDDPSVIGIRNSIAAKAAAIAVFPNPVGNGKPMLRFNAMIKGGYAVEIYNAKGQKLTRYAIQHNGGNAVYALQASAGLKPGIYAINITNQKLERISLKLVVNQ
jgi:hypothetical protein